MKACRETLRIDGRVDGEIECEKTVLVGEDARLVASIQAEEVRIAGFVEGDIAARRRITLEAAAVVIGDLTTPGIVIEEGAKVKGRILIGPDEGKEKQEASSGTPTEPPGEARPAKKAPAGGARSDGPAPKPLAAAPR